MTDSILRSYQAYSYTSLVPFPAVPVVPLTFADLLLTGETDGFAIDATDWSQAYGGYVSVKDTVTPGNNLSNVGLDASNLVQAGTSPKMVHHASSPYVRWSAHNMFLNSASPATQSVTVVTGFQYTVTVTGSGSMAGSSGASGTASSGSPATFTATGTTATWTITGSLTTIQMNRGPIATPYLATGGSIKIGIPQSYDVVAGKYGVLVEPAVTNLAFQSADIFDAAWYKNFITVSADATTAPDGTSTADKVQEDNTNNEHYVVANSAGLILPNSVPFCASCYAKAAERSIIYFAMYDGTNHTTWFDLTGSGSVLTNASGSTSTITAIGGGWYRCTVSRNPSGNTLFAIGITTTDNANTYTGTTGSGAYFWGAMAVSGTTVATSYVPTLAVSVTRAADSIKALASTFNFSNTLVSAYCDFKPQNSPAGNVIFDFSDGGNLERHATYYTSTAHLYEVDSSAQADITAGNLTINTRAQLSCQYKLNAFAASLDGAASVTTPLEQWQRLLSLRWEPLFQI